MDSSTITASLRDLAARIEGASRPKPKRRRRECKTTQLNIRLTPTLKGSIDRMAFEDGISIAELLETAVTMYASERGPK